jgi:flagellar hook-associated protein 2
MSVGGSLSGISFGGLGSGIDTDTIVRQLMQIERQPVFRLQSNQSRLIAQTEIYGQLRSKLNALSTATNALNQSGSFNSVKVSVSDGTVASATADAGAVVGSYALSVTKLAQAHKVASVPQASADSALGYTGSLVVNGKAVQVVATDTLTSIAAKINGSGAGVTAGVINGGAGNAVLSLTSNATGKDAKLQVSEAGGLSGLGLAQGAAAFRKVLPGGAVESIGFSNRTAKLSDQIGRAVAGTVTLNGVAINYDTATDDLDTLAAAINGSAAGVTATVVKKTTTDASGASKDTYVLQLAGLAGVGDVVDPNGLMDSLGVVQKGFGNELVVAQDAEFTVDGMAQTSASNTVKSVIPGVTVTLLKADPAGAKATIGLTRDTDKIKSAAKSFMEAYNGVVEFLKTNSSFDKETFRSGPLFGDAIAQQVSASLEATVFQDVGTGSLKNLTQLGFAVGTDGKLTLNEATLETQAAANPDAVRALFMASGSATGTGLAFVSSTSKTKSSTGVGYSVEITQAATKAKLTAATAQTDPNTGETLTFSGTAFGSANVLVTVAVGTTLSQLVDQINGDSRLRDQVVASIGVDGKLQLESKKFGSSGAFSVVSDLAAGSDNSGIGTAGQAVYAEGLNVAGTINGEPADGNGQFLIGKAGNARTDGLQIQYTGTTTGAVGTVSFQQGLSPLMSAQLEGFTDSANGALTARDNALKSQIDDIDERISSITDTLAIREQTLKLKFLAMERAIARLQQQMAQLQSAG